MLDFAKDKTLWERVRVSEEFSQHRKEIEELYKKAFQTEPRPHSVEEVLINEGRGDGLWRLQFDQLQSSALMALIYPDNEEYYLNLLRTVWAYLNEYTWAPLGHYTEHYYQRTPRDFDYGLLDIFACSVAFSLAEVKNLFKDRFPKLLTDRITYEIRRRTIEPYQTRKFFWESHDNNWTAVCSGAVGSVLIYEAPELYYENQQRIHDSISHYLDSYKDDGMCVEGVGYWYFGFGFLASFAMLERELTGGEVDLFRNEKVKEISKFLQKTFLQRDVLLTFSDSSVNQAYFFALPHMLRQVYGEEIEKLPRKLGSVVYDNTHFNFALRSVIYFSEDNISDDIRTNVTYTSPNSCYFIKRTEGYGFATKGGNNGESHNHIDVGAFILAKGNKQIISDVGAGPYEDGYHTDRRYTFFNPSAYAHSIPVINGCAEDDVRRDDVVVHYDREQDRAYMDIACAYGQDFIRSVKREFFFTDTTVRLRDTLTLTKEAELKERFISIIRPKIEDGRVTIDGAELINEQGIIPTVTVKELKTHLADGTYNAYIIEYTAPRGVSEFTLTFKL
ncbi:MAG: heparinase II/III family protein [Clostridia bacterium]|nr:heparinase II/III family protein [Clostridia bacterium]